MPVTPRLGLTPLGSSLLVCRWIFACAALAACTSTPATCDLACGPAATCVVTDGVPGCLCIKIGKTSCPAGPHAFACVQLQQDLDNCGQCGNACQSNETCIDGACVCSQPLLFIGDSGYFCGRPPNCALCLQPSTLLSCCKTSCADLQNDSQNCGGCGNDCTDAGYCSGGTCICAGGLRACQPQSGVGSTCVDSKNDPTNCGECGAFCSSNEICVDAGCRCDEVTGNTACTNQSGFTTCTQLTTDRLNCGACNNICSGGEECVDGGCDCLPAPNLHRCPADGGFTCLYFDSNPDAGDPCPL